MTMTETMKDAAGPGRGGRMSRQRKRDAVLRLLRGEDLETVSRALGVTAATLAGWRDAFLAAGEAGLASRPADGEGLESGRLKARLGEMLLKPRSYNLAKHEGHCPVPGAADHGRRRAGGHGIRSRPARRRFRPAGPGFG